jgi:glycosyltransferase involved in cell wall biosynthesis
VPVSRDLQRWLRRRGRDPAAKIELIDNGVDTERFRPAAGEAANEPLDAPSAS